MSNNKYKAPKGVLYIQLGDFKETITCLTDPAPTIFEDSRTTEIRFNVMLETQEDFIKYHAMNKYENKTITVGIVYDNGIELKSTFYADHYERRFGSGKGSIVTHVIKGEKNGSSR